MSLLDDDAASRVFRFPRVSGDEPPEGALWEVRDGFSPRERG